MNFKLHNNYQNFDNFDNDKIQKAEAKDLESKFKINYSKKYYCTNNSAIPIEIYNDVIKLEKGKQYSKKYGRDTMLYSYNIFTTEIIKKKYLVKSHKKLVDVFETTTENSKTGLVIKHTYVNGKWYSSNYKFPDGGEKIYDKFHRNIDDRDRSEDSLFFIKKILC